MFISLLLGAFLDSAVKEPHLQNIGLLWLVILKEFGTSLLCSAARNLKTLELAEQVEFHGIFLSVTILQELNFI